MGSELILDISKGPLKGGGPFSLSRFGVGAKKGKCWEKENPQRWVGVEGGGLAVQNPRRDQRR